MEDGLEARSGGETATVVVVVVVVVVAVAVAVAVAALRTEYCQKVGCDDGDGDFYLYVGRGVLTIWNQF